VHNQLSLSYELCLKLADEFDWERSSTGRPSQLDVINIIIEATSIGFADFDNCVCDIDVPEIRMFSTVVKSLGAMTFLAVRADNGDIEVLDYVWDDNYWNFVQDEPSD
jgi:hypothetical protein